MVGNDTFVGLHQDTVDFFFSQGNIIIDDEKINEYSYDDQYLDVYNLAFDLESVFYMSTLLIKGSVMSKKLTNLINHEGDHDTREVLKMLRKSINVNRDRNAYFFPKLTDNKFDEFESRLLPVTALSLVDESAYGLDIIDDDD